MKTLKINKNRIGAPQIYEAPAVEIIEIEVEKGFAATLDAPSDQGGGNPSMAPPASGKSWHGGPWD